MSRQPVRHRPALRYHGGKWRIAHWILAHFPPHRVYVEPYGGAASVLLRKPRSFAEVYNDLDDDMVNFFRVLREPAQALELSRLVALTPWSRVEFQGAYDPTTDPIEWARRTVVRAFMAFGTTNQRRSRTGFRAKAYRRNQTGAQDWGGIPANLAWVAERFQGVTIEHRDAIEVIQQQDGPETLFYCDPPYVQSTRTSLNNSSRVRNRAYTHDLADPQHVALANCLAQVRGYVVLSGYACPLYDGLYGSWVRLDRHALADGSVVRTESLWLSRRTARALQSHALDRVLAVSGVRDTRIVGIDKR